MDDEYIDCDYWYISIPKLVVGGTIIISILLTFILLKVSSGIQIAQAAAPLTISVTQMPEKVSEVSGKEQQEASKDDVKTLNNCQVSERFPQRILQWCELITRYANQRHLDPDLLAALILQESAGDPTAYSHSGAVGLMQVMPRDGISANFMCKNGPCFGNRPSITELQDPDFNISYGTKMLSGLINKYGNIRDALKAYGPMDVGYYYSERVLALYEKYKD